MHKIRICHERMSLKSNKDKICTIEKQFVHPGKFCTLDYREVTLLSSYDLYDMKMGRNFPEILWTFL